MSTSFRVGVCVVVCLDNTFIGIDATDDVVSRYQDFFAGDFILEAVLVKIH